MATLLLRPLALKHFGKGCGTSVILREKTSWLSIATVRERWIVAQALWPNSCSSRSISLLSQLYQRSVQPSKRPKRFPLSWSQLQDPVATGLIDSLARPGGNITGLATLGRELSGKRLELFKETVPTISRVGVLWDANAPAASDWF